MPTIFVVPTPIGNIQDITVRVFETLKNTKFILSEDTRVTRKLFGLLGIDFMDKTFLTYNDTNEKKMIPHVLKVLSDQNDVALVSDAGMPLINDPGYKLISFIRQNEELNESVKIEVLPGPSAVLTALVSSGFPPDRFTYLGYFPRKPNDAKKLLLSIKRRNKEFKSTYISFESPNRLVKSLLHFEKYLGDRVNIAICNELTKLHEKIIIGSPTQLLKSINTGSINLKGEVTLVFYLI